MKPLCNKNKQVKVLIAEDNPVVAQTLRLSLEKMGCQVIGSAVDGEKAIAMTLNMKPDIILMDIQMPKLNGLKAAGEILKKYSVPIIIVTSHDDQNMVQEASQTGVAAFLIKPPKRADIERAITIALARHEDLEELRRVNQELQNALDEIHILKGIIPICASCKKIRDDKGYWEKIETYIAQHSDANFTHGICPDCAQKLYPEIAKNIEY